MEFNLTDTQRMYVDTVRRFAPKEVAPFVAEYDSAERCPIEIGKKMGPLGLLGGVIPEEYGGQGLDYMTMTVGMEEMPAFDPLLAGTIAPRTSGDGLDQPTQTGYGEREFSTLNSLNLCLNRSSARVSGPYPKTVAP